MPKFLLLAALILLYNPFGSVGFNKKEGSPSGFVIEKHHSKRAPIIKSATRPVADAGPDLTTEMPLDNVILDGTGTVEKNPQGGYIFYKWEKIGGPSQGDIRFPSKSITSFRNLAVGTYLIKLTIRINSGPSASDTLKVTVKADPAKPGPVSFNANTKVTPYTEDFQYGANPSSYGNGWDDTSIARIALKAGVHSLRLPLPDYFVGHYGYKARLEAFHFYTHQLGMKAITLFVERPRKEYEEPHTHVFKNLYEPIWDDGANGTPVNENNYFAHYIYKLVKLYGKDIKFWEVVNEPDITGFWDNGNKDRSNNWWDNPPQAYALLNLKAPVFSYIRMLRITYEIVKKYDPDAYITPGGLGYPAFLDALLRYTDNPDGGKVSSKYPLTGGAYFDAVSYHIYPAYQFKKWDNSVGAFKWSRYSDRAADALFDLKNDFEKVLTDRGYDGKKHPKKLFLLTETNLASKSFGDYYGSEEIQRNFIIKALVKAQKNNIKQYYTFVIGDFSNPNTAKNANDLMGLYENLKRDQYGQEKLTEEGKAFKTTSELLYGWSYDAVRTKALNLPENTGGAAFKKGQKYRYVLWAKTHIDKSEKANATYSFPASLDIDSLYSYAWNYSVDSKVKMAIGSKNIPLTGAPLFFTEIERKVPANQPPVANTGKNETITLPVNAVTLDGSASSDEDGEITNYQWEKKSGPEDFVIASPKEAKTEVSELSEGRYIFRLTVTDNSGANASAEVAVTVKKSTSPPSKVPPVVDAGNNQILYLPAHSAVLNGSASSDQDVEIVSYYWEQTSGPSAAKIETNDRATTKVSSLVAGVYVFKLTVKDKKGEQATDQVTIHVKSGANARAIANAGANRTITLPKDTILLDGSASTGSINSWYWSKESGPSGGSITQMGDKAVISDLHPGIYHFYLTVKGEVGWPSSDKVVIKVKEKEGSGESGGSGEKDKRALANAGIDRTVTLPKDTIHLEGSVTQGTAISWYWSKESGPSGGKIQQKGSDAIISDLSPGTYAFYLNVSGTVGWPSSDKVIIRVKGEGTGKPVENTRAIANAGNNRTVTLPKDTLILDGSSTTGSVISWYWSKEKGPEGGHIHQEGANAIISQLNAGVYYFYLTVTGKVGWPSSDKVVVTVKNNRMYSRKMTTSQENTDTTKALSASMPSSSFKKKTAWKAKDSIQLKQKSGGTLKFTVFPNPTHNRLTITFPKTSRKDMTCRIVDITGKVRRIYYLGKVQKTLAGTIDLGDLSNGIYFIQIYEGNAFKGVRKVVKF